MTLLLNSNIHKRLKESISGHICRAGGEVNQLLDYENCYVTDVNIYNGGFGSVHKLGKIKKIEDIINTSRKYIKQEFQFYRKGHAVPRDRKTIVMDMHSAWDNISLKNKFDSSISSNLVEHSFNPILLLLNFFFITRKDGYQYHAIPHYRYTYDRFRTPTSLSHMIEDFEKIIDQYDTSHNEDYFDSAVIKDGWQKEFHKTYPVSYPYMHFHVFDENNTRELIEFVFTDVVNDIIKTDAFSDNIVLFKNRLNNNFLDKYSGLLKQYFGDENVFTTT